MRAPAEQPDRADQSARRPATDRIRGGAESALGRIGVGLQRARPGLHLSILQLRCAGARPQARARRTTPSSRPTPLPWLVWSTLGPRRGTSSVWRPLALVGRYGFFEALDFTPTRVPDGERVAIVRAFMAHHQGMTDHRYRRHPTGWRDAAAVSMPNRLSRRRSSFCRSGCLATSRRPLHRVSETMSTAKIREIAGPGASRSASPWSATPDIQLLSNGRYSVMLTAAGSGYSIWRDLAVTRWREDATCDDWGSYILLRDVASGESWSATYQPTGAEPEAYDVTFNEHHAEFARRDGELATTLEVLVSAEDDAEVRRVTISNLGDQPREVEVTSYAELVLAPQAADVAHPAFSKLFVETEHLAGLGAILATRRRRAPTEPQVWAAHLAVVDGAGRGQARVRNRSCAVSRPRRQRSRARRGG